MDEQGLPKTGLGREELFAQMEELRGGDADWSGGRLFGLVYRTDDDVMAVGKEAYGRFITENGLSPFAFPSLLKFENEVVAMTARLLNGGGEAAGNITSGGSESILMAVKAARDHARATRPGVTHPELVMPTTAHPGWDKAAHYLGLKVVHVPVGSDFRADPEAMRKAVTPDTILMIGSAPTYPHGVVDPIDALGAIAQEHGLWLHVDACVGGFVLPFARKLGYAIPPFDFAVPGVSSISADVHKYGFAPKGASTILYRDDQLRIHQYFAYADWPGGVYGTPTLLGARPGGAVAAAWAVMRYLGEEGYLRLVKGMMETTTRFIAGVRRIPGLRVLGEPHMTLFAIAADGLDVFAVGDAMKKRRWYMDNQQLPPSLHVTVSPRHGELLEALLADLAEATEEVRRQGDSPELSESAAMYGMLGSMPDRREAQDMALQFLNSLYRV